MSFRTVDDYFAERLAEQQKVAEAEPSTTKYNFDFTTKAKAPVYSMTDFQKDPQTVKDFELVLSYLKDQDDFMSTVSSGIDQATDPDDDTDPVEFLRDDIMRIETAANKAVALRDAPEEVKAAYRRMKTNFDRAEVSGIGEQFDRVLDYGSDILFNYGNAAYLGPAILTGAASAGLGAGATLATRVGAGKTASKLLDLSIRAQNANKAVNSSRLMQPTKTKSTVFGAGYTGLQNVAEQNLDINIDARDSFSPAEVAAMTAFGGAGGYLIHGAGEAFGKRMLKRRAEELAELPPPPLALPDLRLPNQPPSEPARRFQDELQALIDNPGENFRQAVSELLQARTDAPRNFRLAIQEAMGEPDPAQKIQQLLGEATGARQEELLNQLAETIEYINRNQNPEVTLDGTKVKVQRGKTTSEFSFGTPEDARKMAEKISASANKLVDEVATGGEEPGKQLVLSDLEELIQMVGGGQNTFEEAVDLVLARARKDAGTPKMQDGLLMDLNKLLTKFTSYAMFGKSAGFLTPYNKISPTAKLLQEKTSTEFAMDFRNPLKERTPQKLISEDFAEAQRNITHAFYREFIKAVYPIAERKFNVALNDEINDALSLSLRGRSSSGQNYSAAVNASAAQIRKVYQATGELLSREGFISTPVKNYIPRQWKRSAIEDNPDEFKRLLIRSGEAKNQRDADTIVEGMLNKELQLTSGSRDYFFSSNRTFEKITDDAMFEKFLNTDVQQTFFNYMTQAGMALAKKRVFGVKNLNDFERKWVAPIAKEARAGGASWTGRDSERVKDLYKTLTGEGLEEPNAVLDKAFQGTQLVQRMALLPLATLGSFTEIMLNFGVAGGATVDGFKTAFKISGAKNKQAIDDLLAAHEIGFKTMTEEAYKKLTKELGMTPEEAWHEMQEFGLIMEQSLESMADRLAGDMVSNEGMQKASNVFFRLTLLDQWTKFVQNVSFQTGKKYLTNTIDQVAAHGSAPITRRMQTKLDDLAEFGIDAEEAKAWVNRGRNVNDKFYKSILNGAARYTNQIILQPTRMSGLKPRAHSTPFGSLLFQLMGYPTAFTNNILKRGAKRLLKDPDIAAEKLLPTALAMTAVAGATNYMRTRGEGFEDKSAAQIGFEALSRWGGNGLLLDQAYRAAKNVEYLGTPGLVTGLFGPTVGDTAVIFRRGKIASVLGTKVPGYGAGTTVFGEDAIKDYKKELREIDESIEEGVEDINPFAKRKALYSKGGVVDDVPNVPTEPDERIDKMTGLPYNEQAGEAFMDEEELSRSLLARRA